MDTRDDFRDPGATGSPRQGSRTSEGLKGEARVVAEKARRTSGRLAGRAWEQAEHAVKGRKDDAAQRLDAISGALRDSAQRFSGGTEDSLGRYATRAADGVERAARYLREHDPEDMVREVEGFARRRPEMFVGAAFVTGLLVARFLKSSGGRGMDDFTGSGGRSVGDPWSSSEEHAYGSSVGQVGGIGPAGTGSAGGYESGADYGGQPRDASPDDFEGGKAPGGTRIGG